MIKIGYLTGLASVTELVNKKNQSFDSDRPKTKWFSLKNDGDSAKVVFLQEADEGAANYSKKNGLVHFVLEHANPDNWTKKAECTADDGQCYGCEKGWYQKVTLYANVLVDDGTNEPYVAVFSRGLSKGSIATLLLEFAAEDGTITDKWFRIKRQGAKKDTTYMLMPSKAHELNVEDYELFDLDHVPFKVAYERQEAYYLDGQTEQAEAPTPAAVDAEW